MRNNDHTELLKENASLKTQIAFLQKQMSLEKEKFIKNISVIIEEGNPNLQSIMKTLEPILQEQFNKARLNDNTFIQAFISAQEMAMQQAYTSYERKRSLDIEEALKNKQLDNDFKLKNKQLNNEHDINLKELELKRQEVESNVALKKAQIEQINQSIIDNRFIKAAEILGNVISMGLSANIDIPEGLWASLFDCINSLLGKNYDKEASANASKGGSTGEIAYNGKRYQYQGGVLMEVYEEKGGLQTRNVTDEHVLKYFKDKYNA